MMKKKSLGVMSMALMLVTILSSLDLVYAGTAGQSAFKERVQKRSKEFNSTWLNAPRRRHTDSDYLHPGPTQTPERQMAFKKRSERFNDTWVNAPRNRHADTATTEARQATFKQRCKVFNETWLNAPRKPSRDSDYLEIVGASKTVK